MRKRGYVDHSKCVERIQSLQKQWVPSLAIVAFLVGILAFFTGSRPAIIVAMLAAAVVLIINLALLKLLWNTGEGRTDERDSGRARKGLGVVVISAIALLALVILVVVDWIEDKEDRTNVHLLLLGFAVLFPAFLWLSIPPLLIQTRQGEQNAGGVEESKGQEP
jgi:hypothetical protein